MDALPSASYEWVLALQRPVVERVRWHSSEHEWKQELYRWREEVESFNNLGDRYFLTVAKGLAEPFNFIENEASLIWHILPREELRGKMPGILSAKAALGLLELDFEEAVVLAAVS